MTTRQAALRPHGEEASALAEGVTVIVPAYNEERSVGAVLERLRKTMADSGYEHEIIVIDDGSSDGTAAAVRQHDVRLVEHRQNMGYGAALKTGIRHARYPIIAITDADGTYPNERLPELVHMVVAEGVDMAVGARTGENVSIPFIRRPA
ncbi:MAG: glycosyltransferase family 2 protein, partial [Chloroflexi bacterium]|nr:glycosyltransferase family 2 protein [Chloroflexota bacterium]